MNNLFEKIKKAVFGDKLQELQQYQSRYNYQRAMELMDTDKAQAYDFLTKEVGECDQNGYAHYWIGRLQHEVDNYGLAIKAVNNAILRLKEDKVWLSASFLLRAMINEALGNEKEALEDFAAAITFNPEESYSYERRGEHFYNQKEYDKSDADFKKFTELEPGNPYGFAALGRNALEQDKVDDARKLFEYSIKLSADYACSYPFLAECKLKQGDKAGCIDDCLHALSLDENTNKAFDVLFNMNDEDEFALLRSRLLLKIQQEPNKSLWHFLLALKYSYREEFYAAIKELKDGHSIDPRPFYLVKIGEQYNSLGDYRRAEVYYRRALDGHDDYFDAHKGLGNVLVHQLRYEDALKEFETCHVQRPEDVIILGNLSGVHRMLGNFEKAKEFAETAISLNSNYSDSWLKLARVYEMSGDDAEMTRTLENLVNLETVSPRDKAISLALLGRTEEAMSVVDQEWTMTTNRQYAEFCLDKSYILVKANKLAEAEDMIIEAMKYGMRDFDSLLHQDNLECMNKIAGLDDVVFYWRGKAMDEFLEENKALEEVEDGDADNMVSVPFIPEQGLCKVHGEVNGLPLAFIFDTGASDVTISTVEASFMKKNGYLEERDFGGKENYMTASGAVEEGTVINLRQVTVGTLSLKNVRATVVKSQNAPLLLGQSVLGRFAKVEVDNSNKEIRFTSVIKQIEVTEIKCAAFFNLTEEKYDKAAMLFHKAFEAEQNPEYLYYEGICWSCYGDNKKYISIMEEALALFPDDEYVNYQYGYSYFINGRYEESIAAFRKCVERFPNSDDSRYMLAYVLTRQEKYEEALSVLEDSLAYNPDFLYYHFAKAVALYRLGRNDEAIPEWKIASAIPFDENYGIVHCEALLRLGEIEQCRENIQKCLSMVENSTSMYQTIVWIDAAAYYAEIGDNEEAMHWLEKTLSSTDRCWYRIIHDQFDYEKLRSLPGALELIKQYEDQLEADLSKKSY